VNFTVFVEDLQLLWLQNGPLTDPETRADIIDLLAQKNASLMGRSQKADFERAVESRLSIVDARERVVYPEELRYMADSYCGSAGSKVLLTERQVPDGRSPFTYKFGYKKKPEVSVFLLQIWLLLISDKE
jgi:hypothetical protein